MKIKHYLIIVNTPYNLMLALQLRTSILIDSKVDVFLGRPSLYEIFVHNKLNIIFDNVFYYDTLPHMQSLWGFFNPSYEIERISSCQALPEYTDIFFWNPDWIMYNYYKKYRNKVSWHVYADSIAGFTTDIPNGYPSNYGNSIHSHILNIFDRIIWKVCYVRDMTYDFYMFNSNLACFNASRNIIDIPLITKSNISYIEKCNQIWEYKKTSFKERYLYLDTGRDGYVTNEDINESLQQLVDIVGIDNLLVKPHPAMNIEDYSINGLHIMNTTMPFELICLNEDISDKVLICISSGAAMLLPMCFDIHVHTISTILFENFHHDNKKEMLEIWNKLSAASELVHCPNTKEEFINIVKELES